MKRANDRSDTNKLRPTPNSGLFETEDDNNEDYNM